MDAQERENFVMLTQAALNEPDVETFVGYLLKRDLYVNHLVKKDPEILGGMAEEYLLRETLILERLENERKKTIEKMEKLAKNKRAIRSYAAVFPFPPTPMFFKKIG